MKYCVHFRGVIGFSNALIKDGADALDSVLITLSLLFNVLYIM